jgi:hypothetical protein
LGWGFDQNGVLLPTPFNERLTAPPLIVPAEKPTIIMGGGSDQGSCHPRGAPWTAGERPDHGRNHGSAHPRTQLSKSAVLGSCTKIGERLFAIAALLFRILPFERYR